jgi:hypothetical protein
MTTFFETKGINHDLSPPYAYESNGLSEHMNRTIVMIVRSMILDCADVISQAFGAEAYSSAVHIKNRLLHSAFKLKKFLFKIIFGDKTSIKHLYPFGAKCYLHVPEQKQIRISKLSSRAIKSYVVGSMELSKIL